jgi:hypothetical protein
MSTTASGLRVVLNYVDHSASKEQLEIQTTSIDTANLPTSQNNSSKANYNVQE